MVLSKTPYMKALLRLAHPSVRADEAAAVFISKTIFSTAPDPAPLLEVASDLRLQSSGFVYDRTSGLVFQGTREEGERIAAALMQLHHMSAPANWRHAHDLLEKHHEPLVAEYLEEGFGLIGARPAQSSVGWVLHAGQDVLLSPQEKLALGAMAIPGR